MPFLGAHMSAAGGLHRAFERIKEVGGEALQIFTRNQRQWAAPPIGPEEAALFREQWRQCGCIPVAAHGSYLINLAEPDPIKAQKSIAAFSEEIRRALVLGIPYLAMHPGFHMGKGVEAGLDRFVQNLDQAIALAECSGERPGSCDAGEPGVTILLETTAGQGSSLGARFEEMAFILNASRHSAHLGVCFDTCHSFAAGYDIRTPEAYHKTFLQLDESVGLHRLKLFHLNDSRKPLGARVDRHEHIGEGEIGLSGFRLLMNDPRFSDLPMVLETPKEKNLIRDKRNLAVLRSLIQP